MFGNTVAFGTEANDDSRLQMSNELERLKEQSRIALEQTWARVEELQEEEKQIASILVEKELRLNRLKMMTTSCSSLPMTDSQGEIRSESFRRLSGDNTLIDEESIPTPPKSSTAMLTGGIDPDEDVRITLMYEEREDEILEIKQNLGDKELLLQSLQDDTAEQQETIFDLQKVLEEVQSASSGINMEHKVENKERVVADSEAELEALQEELTEAEQTHLELEEEWNEHEDLIADSEAEAADKLAAMQSKLEKYTSEIDTKDRYRSDMLQDASQRLKGMRKDFTKFLGRDTSHTLLGEVRRSFAGLLQKEDELAGALIRRLGERKSLIPSTLRLQIIQRQSSLALSKLSNLSKQIEAKMRQTNADGSCAGVVDQINVIQEQIASAFDEIMEELVIRLDNMESNAVEDTGGETVGAVKRSVEKLNYTIQARFRQILCALPEAAEQPPDEGNNPEASRQVSMRNLFLQNLDKEEKFLRSSRRDLFAQSLQSSLEPKEEEVQRLEEELAFLEGKNGPLLEKARKAVDRLDEEVQFISRGLREKDRMIDAILSITKERRDTEAYLVEELEYVFENGIIDMSDFVHSDQKLLEKLGMMH